MNASQADETWVGDTVRYMGQEFSVFEKSDFLYAGTLITHFKLGCNEGGEQIPHWISRYEVDPLYAQKIS